MIKKLIALIIIFIGLYFIYDHNYFGSHQFVRDIKKEVYVPATNEYVKTNTSNSFVKMTNDFVPDNKQEILDIYYTVLNSGWDTFTFYCNYESCINDVNSMSVDSVLLSNLNSFVSPYNQYSTVSTYTTPLFNSKVTIIVKRTYDEYMIRETNKEVNKIYANLNLANYSVRDQIRKIHDYIINNTEYDKLKIDNINDNTYSSSTAYGLIFEGKAVCSGYADTMALFLDKMGIPNFRVASETHVWNLVKLDNKWYHLDLTWDDPYSENGDNIISYYYYLIDYQTLKSKGTIEHIFDQNVYKEGI